MTDLIALPEPAMKTHGPFSDEEKHWFTQEQMLDFANLIRQDEKEKNAVLIEQLTAHRRVIRAALNGEKPSKCEFAAAIRARTTT